MAKKTTRKIRSYPTGVRDEEWEFCAPYLTLMKEDAPQQEYPLRAVFNALRWMVRAGCPWRLLPHDLPPWAVVHQQTLLDRGGPMLPRLLAAGICAAAAM